jgi:TRAP-type C4-dicarboxylate transport system permease small subunit
MVLDTRPTPPAPTAEPLDASRAKSHGVERAATLMACVMVVVLTLLTLADVVGRNALNKPLTGATEVTELLLAAMTFLFYPRLAWRSMHISVDLFDWFRGPTMQRLHRTLAGLLGAAVFGALAWQIGLQAVQAAEYGDVTAQLSIPVSWQTSFMALLCAVTAGVYLATIVITPPAPGNHHPID